MTEDENIVPGQSARNNQVEDGEIENEEVISERSPSIDSVTHPYRSIMKDTSFPRCHLTRTPKGMAETYTRSMLVLGNGLPIWDALGNINRPEEHLKSGVSIGDVGVLDKDGDFECFFNVFEPPPDKMGRMCPPDMVPLLPPPEATDIATDTNYYPPGTTLVSKNFESTLLNSSPLHIDFKINAREGGILVLPDGASREDLISTTRLREYVQQNALSWYIFMNKRSWPEIERPNGSLYVVTGRDEAPSWAVAAADPHRVQKYPLSIEFHAEQSPVWRTSCGIRHRSSKVGDPSQRYSVFLRGMKVGVSLSDWTNYVLQNEPPSKIPFYNVLAVPNTGLSAKFQSFIERRKTYPDQYIPPSTRFIFSPSDILLRFVLEEVRGVQPQSPAPRSEVAIIEDIPLTAYYKAIGDGCAQDVFKFLLQVLSTHDIQNRDGLAMLIPKEPGPEEAEHSKSLVQSLTSVPSLLKDWYNARSQRRCLVAKLRKIFPGSPVPPFDVTQG